MGAGARAAVLALGVAGCVPSAARDAVAGKGAAPRGDEAHRSESAVAKAAGDASAEDSAPESVDTRAGGQTAAGGARSEPPQAPSITPPAKEDSKLPKRRFLIKKKLGPGMAAFLAELPRKGLLFAGPLGGNGGRDTLIFVPPGADKSADFRLVYHFHGTYSERIAKKKEGMKKKDWVGWDRLGQAIEGATLLQDEQPYNVALIYPLSAGRRMEPSHEGWANKWYDRAWMQDAKLPKYTDSFDTLHEETLAILHDEFGVSPTRTTGRVLVEGHSAGGIALLNIALSGSNHVGDYLFQDASFQGWGDATYYTLLERKADARMTIVMTTNGMVDPFGRYDPWCTELRDNAEAEPEPWAEYKDWCEKMEDDMESVDQVYVHRTRVSHGKQPLHFLGGRELPSAWHESTL